MILIILGVGALIATAIGAGVVARASRLDAQDDRADVEERERARQAEDAHQEADRLAQERDAAQASERAQRDEARERARRDPRSFLAWVFRNQRAAAHTAASDRVSSANAELDARSEDRQAALDGLGGRPSRETIIKISFGAAFFVVAFVLSTYLDGLLAEAVLGSQYLVLALVPGMMGVVVATLLGWYSIARGISDRRTTSAKFLAGGLALSVIWVVTLVGFGIARGEATYAREIAEARTSIAVLEGDPSLAGDPVTQELTNTLQGDLEDLQAEKQASTAIVIVMAIAAFGAEIILWPSAVRYLQHRRLQRLDTSVAEAEVESRAAATFVQQVNDETMRVLTNALHDHGLRIDDGLIQKGTQWSLGATQDVAETPVAESQPEQPPAPGGTPTGPPPSPGRTPADPPAEPPRAPGRPPAGPADTPPGPPGGISFDE